MDIIEFEFLMRMTYHIEWSALPFEKAELLC
jgi:hypothetical protein